MRPIARLRRICLALPEAVEQETWEIPTFRVRDRIFALASAHRDREAVWCKAPPGAAAMLIEAAPARFFRPPYLGHKGWVGIYLEPAPAGESPDWAEIAFIVRRSHALVAPRRLASGPPQTGSPQTGSPQTGSPQTGSPQTGSLATKNKRNR